MTPVRLKPAALRSRVKHSTTEPLPSLDILVKNELCIPLERGSNVLSTGEGFICLSFASKLKIAVRLCSICKKTFSFSAIVF